MSHGHQHLVPDNRLSIRYIARTTSFSNLILVILKRLQERKHCSPLMHAYGEGSKSLMTAVIHPTSANASTRVVWSLPSAAL